MPETLIIGGQEPGELPDWQSPERIQRVIKQAKIGDVVHIVPKGERLEYYERNLGMNQIHGCVGEQSTPDRLVLWSTYYTANINAFEEDEKRSFTVKDVHLIERESAEEFILKASGGKFSHGSEASVTLPEGEFVIKVDSDFDGWGKWKKN